MRKGEKDKNGETDRQTDGQRNYATPLNAYADLG